MFRWKQPDFTPGEADTKGLTFKCCILTSSRFSYTKKLKHARKQFRKYNGLSCQRRVCCWAQLRSEPTSIFWTGQELTGQHLFPTGSLVVGPLFNTIGVGCSMLVVPQGQGMHLTYEYRFLLGLRCTDAMQFWNHDHRHPKTKGPKWVAEGCLLTCHITLN